VRHRPFRAAVLLVLLALVAGTAPASAQQPLVERCVDDPVGDVGAGETDLHRLCVVEHDEHLSVEVRGTGPDGAPLGVPSVLSGSTSLNVGEDGGWTFNQSARQSTCDGLPVQQTATSVYWPFVPARCGVGGFYDVFAGSGSDRLQLEGSAQRSPAPTRHLQGATALEAALAFSRVFFPDDASDLVLLARADDVGDATAAAGPTGVRRAPLLLTPGSALDDRVATEITRLGAQQVLILGGEQAVSPQVEADVRALGVPVVERVGGATRIQTAALLFERFRGEDVHLEFGTEVLLVRAFGDPEAPSRAFIDSVALAGMPGSQETTQGTHLDPCPCPPPLQGLGVLLTATDHLSAETAAVLDGVTSVRVIGGGIAESVLDEIRSRGIEVTRIAGATRVDTAAAVARRLLEGTSGPARVVLLEGDAPAAWASGYGAAAGTKVGSGRLITLMAQGGTVPAATADVLRELADGSSLLCDPFLSADVCQQAAGILHGG
jgi:putative cell wall-binding protein